MDGLFYIGLYFTNVSLLTAKHSISTGHRTVNKISIFSVVWTESFSRARCCKEDISLCIYMSMCIKGQQKLSWGIMENYLKKCVRVLQENRANGKCMYLFIKN